MSQDVFRRSLSIAEENQIRTVNFFGGEPLVNPLALEMLQETMKRDLSLMLATNCRPLAGEDYFLRFLDVTREFRRRILILTTRDRFHLKFFDPIAVISRLNREGYQVMVNSYSDEVVAISEYNAANHALRKLDTSFSCCKSAWTDYLGILPDGAWTICPPSLEPFGNIFANSLQELVTFKRGLPFQFKEGCTECMKDFKGFHREFEAAQNRKGSRKEKR